MGTKGFPTKLPEEAKAYIVTELACFEKLSKVVDEVEKRFGIKITPQAAERYNPTRAQSRNLSKQLKLLFEETRKRYIEDTSDIAISHRADRLRRLQRMVEKADSVGNIVVAAALLEQAAKEVGDAYTNRRQVEHSGGMVLNVTPDDANL